MDDGYGENLASTSSADPRPVVSPLTPPRSIDELVDQVCEVGLNIRNMLFDGRLQLKLYMCGLKHELEDRSQNI